MDKQENENTIEITDSTQDKISEVLVEVDGTHEVIAQLQVSVNSLNIDLVNYLLDRPGVTSDDVIERIGTLLVLAKTVIHTKDNCNSEEFSNKFNETIARKYLEILEYTDAKICLQEKASNFFNDRVNNNTQEH